MAAVLSDASETPSLPDQEQAGANVALSGHRWSPFASGAWLRFGYQAAAVVDALIAESLGQGVRVDRRPGGAACQRSGAAALNSDENQVQRGSQYGKPILART